MSEFGFVGLGRMGQSMAINMSKKGFGLAVFDIREDAMKPFTQFNNCRQAMSANDTIGSGANIITVLDFKLFYRGFLLPPAHQLYYGAGDTLNSL